MPDNDERILSNAWNVLKKVWSEMPDVDGFKSKSRGTSPASEENVQARAEALIEERKRLLAEADDHEARAK